MLPPKIRALFGALTVVGLVSACAPSSMSHGKVRTWDENDPIVSIEAGNLDHGGGTRLFVRYVIDRASQTCWMMTYSSVNRMRCCELARVAAAREFITWPVEQACPPS